MIRLGLESICYLCEKLDNPQDKLRFIHIAGTNGKGSTGAYISSILKKVGMTVGHYTSPAVFLREEIIKVNNKNITKKDYDELSSKIDLVCEEIENEGKSVPTEFERLTAMAFLYFLSKKCDIVVLECGMGGETDATNIVKNTIAAVITSVSMDHTDYLGDSIDKIAAIKAGIIKVGCQVITSNKDRIVLDEIYKKVISFNDDLMYIHCPHIKNKQDKIKNIDATNDRFKYIDTGLDLKDVPLMGINQLENASLAATCIYALANYLNDNFNITIFKEDVKKGIQNTKWPGRFQKLTDKPVMIIDGAHNEGAAIALRENILHYYKNKRIIAVVGMLYNKDHKAVLSKIADVTDAVLTVSTLGERGYSAEDLAKDAILYNNNVSAVGGIEEALDIAYLMAKPKDVILIFGTLSFLKDVKKWIDIKKY